MIIDPGLPDHWKLRALKKASGREDAIEWLIRLWGNCQLRRSNRFDNAGPEIIAAICCYDGDPAQFLEWLLTFRIIERDANTLMVHGWNDYNAALIANWKNGAKGGRPKTSAKPKVNPKLTPPPPNGKNGNFLQLPEDLRTAPGLQEAWSGWIEHRSEIHHKLTPTAVREQIKEIRELGPDRAVAAIKHSIANGYQGLYEPHQKPTGSSKPANKYKSEI
jgi:hypothetical protein